MLLSRPMIVAGLPDADPARLRLALGQLVARLTKARRQFRRQTGFTAVTTLRIDNGTPSQLIPLAPLSPPVHPLCAELLRKVSNAPCDEQWQDHLRASRSSPHSHTHTCPLGLRCSCVPIYLAGTFVGVAKLVADTRTPAADFEAATATLALTVSISCHECYASVLQDELKAMRQRRQGPRNVEPGAVVPAGDGGATLHHNAVVARTLEHLHARYQERDLSLRTVAAAVGCNGKYLTHLFTQTVGQRMRGYLVGLRVAHATQELLSTDAPIKQIAYRSGFGDAGSFVRVFHRHVGVSPATYRRIFTGP